MGLGRMQDLNTPVDLSRQTILYHFSKEFAFPSKFRTRGTTGRRSGPECFTFRTLSTPYTLQLLVTLHWMEADDPPVAGLRPGTPHLLESSEPPSDPTTVKPIWA